MSFTYALTGQRHTMTDASGQTTYTYDALNRLTTKQTPAQGTLRYTYYPAGNVETIASSNAHGVSVGYTYDDVGRLSTVVDNRLSANNTTTYSYDAGSNVATAAYPNNSGNAKSTFTYDTLNRLTALSTPVSSYAYTLGPTGNRTKATELGGRMLAWSYDGIYRLTNEAVTADPDNVNGSVGYVLDPVGNRKSAASTLSGVNSSGTFTYNSDDELMPGQGDTYDNSGNTLSTGGKTFTYDSENHLMSMNGGAVTLTYDGDGNRVAKTAGSVTTLYLVDDVNPTGLPQVMEELVNGAVQREYTYGLDRIGENQLAGGAWTASFYGADGMDSVRQLTNSAGTVTDTYEYDAFGNMVNKTGPSPGTYTPNNYLYRGEQWDPDLGLYYLRARYYNPVTGRFLNVDPLAGQGQRRYEYADADPVDGSDPTGKADILDFALQLFVPPPIPWKPDWCRILGSNSMGGYLPACGGPGFGDPPTPPPPCIGANCHQHEVTVSFWPYAAAGHGHVGVGVDSPMFNEFTWGFATLYPKSSQKEHKCLNEVGTIKHDQDTYPFKAVDYMRIPTDAAGADAMQQAIYNRRDNSGQYNVCFNNCAMFVESVLTKGNVSGASMPYPFDVAPRKYWEHLASTHSWYPSYNY